MPIQMIKMQILVLNSLTKFYSQTAVEMILFKQDKIIIQIIDYQQLKIRGMKRYNIQKMQAYTNMVKTLYTTGKDYIWSVAEKAKQPMVKVDKTATIYQAKCFNDSKIDPKKCITILAKFIYLFNQGEPFSEAEVTTLFFSITKLLQTDDPNLRRLIYTFVKQMSDQPSIYVVTSSLLKDIHHKDCNYRRNSLRTLPVVLDSSNLVQVQRYIKQLMNDPDPGVVSAALLSGLQMYNTNQQVVRKWGTQVTEKLKSKDKYVQYHSLALLGQIKYKDSKFLKKTLQMLMKENLAGLAAIQHLRMLKIIVQQNYQFDSSQVTEFNKFVLKQVRSADDNVVIEASRIACESSFFSNKQLLDVVKVLQRFLVSQSTAKKYTVLKLYNSLLKNSSRKNLVVNVKQIQKVLKDKNVNLSATAASILLRICSQNYLEMLLRSLSKTMSQMSIDYKVDVIKSLVNVLTTYPKQFAVINQFVFQILREQDSQELRRQAIQVLSYEITQIGGQAKKQCLQQIAKFLSSAKYQKIHFQILGIINRQIKPEDVTSDLLKSLIHQIYLQQGSVRACGLSTLMKISQIHAGKRKILQRTIAKFQKDRDQQVRQRVIFKTSPEKISQFELDMIQGYLLHNCQAIQSSKDPNILAMSNIKKWGQQIGVSLMKKKKKSNAKIEEKQKQSIQEQKHYKQLFLNHSTFKNYGTLRKINARTLISDPDAQLQVSSRIFLFDQNLVIMYQIQNRFETTALENVKVQLKHSGQQFQTQHVIPAKQIPVKSKGQCYVGLTRNQQSEQMIPEETISSMMKYIAKEYAGQTLKASYDDQFSLESFQIKLSTYFSSWLIQSSDFESQWSKIKGESSQGTYKLAYASKQAAIQQLIKRFGMTCISNEQTKNSRNLVKLAGKYLGTFKTLLTLVIGFDTNLGCIAKVTAISEKQDLAEQLLQSFA